MQTDLHRHSQPVHGHPDFETLQRGAAQFVTFRAGGGEKVFEYIADNALIWQDTPRLLLHANRQAESPSGYDLTGGSDANLANCYVITPSMLAAHPDGLFCFPAKSPVQSGTVYWDDLLLDTNDYMVFHRRQDDGPDGR